MRYSKSSIHRYFEHIRQMALHRGHDPNSSPVNYDCEYCPEYETRLRRCRYRMCLMQMPDIRTDDIDENCPNCMHYDPIKRVCEPGSCVYLSDSVFDR
jgi:hypothetical protein